MKVLIACAALCVPISVYSLQMAGRAETAQQDLRDQLQLSRCTDSQRMFHPEWTGCREFYKRIVREADLAEVEGL